MERVANKQIRDRLRVEDIRYWVVAKEIGITASVFSVWMRSELTAERRKRVEAAIDEIIAQRQRVS